MVWSEAQRKEIKKYLTSPSYDSDLQSRSKLANESGAETSDTGTPTVNERGKRARKQPQIFKFPSPVKKAKAPVTPAPTSSRKSGRTKQRERKTARQGKPNKRNRKLVLEMESEAEEDEGDNDEGDAEDDSETQSEEDEEEGEDSQGDEHQASSSTGGRRPKGFVDSEVVIHPQKLPQKPTVTHSTRGRSKGGDPGKTQTPAPQQLPLTGAPDGMSFEVLTILLTVCTH